MEQILDSQLTSSPAREYGGFWVRVVASIIDGLVLAIPNSLITMSFFGSFMMTPGNMEGFDFSNFGKYYITVVAMQILYYALMESSSKQATLGKMAMGLKVTDLQGERIGFGQAVGRYLGKYISAFILCIGFLMVAFNDKKQGLHDKMAGTYVIKAS